LSHKIIAVLAVLTLPIAMAFATAASASVSDRHQAAHGTWRVTPDWGFEEGVLCDSEATPLCMSGYDGSGGLVKGEHYSPGAAQDAVATQNTTICGSSGLVTSDCPFTSGLNLNNMFKKSPILYISNFTNGKLYYADPSDNNLMREGSSGDDFVQDGNLTGSGAGAALIDVQATNALDSYGEYVVACTNGLGNAVEMIVPQDGVIDCAWIEKSS
jgi:hypothetical protein